MPILNHSGSSANQISLTYTCQTVVIDFYQSGSTFIWLFKSIVRKIPNYGLWNLRKIHHSNYNKYTAYIYLLFDLNIQSFFFVIFLCQIFVHVYMSWLLLCEFLKMRTVQTKQCISEEATCILMYFTIHWFYSSLIPVHADGFYKSFSNLPNKV